MSYQNQFLERLAALDGYWQYKEGRYLALLASGKLSDVFCNAGAMTTRPDEFGRWIDNLAVVIASKISSCTKSVHGDVLLKYESVSVIGPGMGGITLAYALANSLLKVAPLLNLMPIHAFFTEPVETELDGKQVKFQKFRFDLPPKTLVIFVEDVITTGGSVQKTYSAVAAKEEQAGKLVLFPIITCLVDRRAENPEGKHVEDLIKLGDVEASVTSLARIYPKTWDTLEEAKKTHPAVVEAIKPKANWEKLVRG